MRQPSAELLGILAVGVGLASLVYTGQARNDRLVNSLKSQMDAMESRLDDRMDAMESRMDDRMDAMESRMDAMESRMASMEQRQARIEGLLEGRGIIDQGTSVNPDTEKE